MTNQPDNAGEPQADEKPPFIATVKNYVNQHGHNITAFVAEHGELPDDHPRFVGRASIQMQTPAGPQGMPFEFPIDADNIERAFDMFESVAQTAGREAVQQMQQQSRRLQVPTPGQARSLLGPNGEFLQS